jgi:hypothetical protein
MIRLGDYIDLEGGLEVETYKGEGYFNETNRELGTRGCLLRLVVAGINSFHSGRGTKATGGVTVNGDASGRYAGTENDGVPHVVFHFQNIPVFRLMNASGSNGGGYAESEMRRYLVDVDGNGTGGAFLAGLRAAGAPKAVMWAPARYVSSKGNRAILNDLLGLPMERELFGRVPGGFLGAADETAANQARLEYYANTKRREKFRAGDGWTHYWTASPGKNETLFCIVNDCGKRMAADANMELGCVPAFCVR